MAFNDQSVPSKFVRKPCIVFFKTTIYVPRPSAVQFSLRDFCSARYPSFTHSILVMASVAVRYVPIPYPNPVSQSHIGVPRKLSSPRVPNFRDSCLTKTPPSTPQAHCGGDSGIRLPTPPKEQCENIFVLVFLFCCPVGVPTPATEKLTHRQQSGR